MVLGAQPIERFGRATFQAISMLALIIIILPLCLVFWLSFFTNEILSLPPESYSLRWYAAIQGQPQFVSGFVTSLKVAVAATVLGLLVSVPASLILSREDFRGREALIQLLMSPLIVPGIVIGLGLYMAFVEVSVFTGLSIVGSAWSLSVGHALVTIPWCMRLLLANLIGLNRSVEEAALSLGATPAIAVFKVTLPLIWPGLVAAILFSFVVSFGNLELSLFLVTPGQTTLPIAILQYLQWKIDPVIAAVSVLQIMIVGIALLITNRFVSLSKVM